MRTLLILLIIAGMMATSGIYAADFGPTTTTKALAGGGDEAVPTPNTRTITLGYQFTGDTVTGVIVT